MSGSVVAKPRLNVNPDIGTGNAKVAGVRDERRQRRLQIQRTWRERRQREGLDQARDRCRRRSRTGSALRRSS